MATFSLITIDNTLSGTNGDVSFAITCDNATGTAKIKYIEVEIQSLARLVDWEAVRPSIAGHTADCEVGPGRNLPVGAIRFALEAPADMKACHNRIEFTIAHLRPKEGSSFPSTAAITFKLKSVTNAVIGNYPDDYSFNTILVTEKKPEIKSLRINPSITRGSGEVTVTYEVINATSCELKNNVGGRIHAFENKDKNQPVRFSGKVYVGSKGTIPLSPLYLHARDGASEAVDYTVADITWVETADWVKVDRFSRQVPVTENKGMANETVYYVTEQSGVLDLVLNERDEMMWAIVQKREGQPATPDTLPCIWKSYDGLSWQPHTYSAKDNITGVISQVLLTIPSELVHCPCLHFGEDELFFVGGSKVDMGICKNTITAVNLSNGSARLITAPEALVPRSTHACVVYAGAQGNNNIWLIGGADKNGNGLNDVWRFDGAKWTQVLVENPAFPKRCQFAATVQTDISGKQSIWISGGSKRYNGDTLNDVWLYKEGRWMRAKEDKKGWLGYSEDWLAAASMCYVRTGKNSTGDAAGTRRYILSNDFSGDDKKLQCRWILGIDIGNNDYKWDVVEGVKKPELSSDFSIASDFAMVTIGFNGCVWAVFIAYLSKDNVIVSDLHYSCPVP